MQYLLLNHLITAFSAQQQYSVSFQISFLRVTKLQQIMMWLFDRGKGCSSVHESFDTEEPSQLTAGAVNWMLASSVKTCLKTWTECPGICSRRTLSKYSETWDCAEEHMCFFSNTSCHKSGSRPSSWMLLKIQGLRQFWKKSCQTWTTWRTYDKRYFINAAMLRIALKNTVRTSRKLEPYRECIA